MTYIQILYDGPIVKRSDAKARGDKFYFTGKPCKHGHVDRRYTTGRRCCECNANSTKKYGKEYRKEYYQKNKDKLQARGRCYYQRNKDWIRKNKDSEKVKYANRNFYQNNKGYFSNYRKLNAEKYATYFRNRRSLIKKSKGSHTSEDITRILDIQSNKCAEPTCGKDLTDGYEVDHIMPIKLGGSNLPDNLQCLCMGCNRRKSAKHPIDWARENGRLL